MGAVRKARTRWTLDQVQEDIVRQVSEVGWPWSYTVVLDPTYRGRPEGGSMSRVIRVSPHWLGRHYPTHYNQMVALAVASKLRMGQAVIFAPGMDHNRSVPV